MTSRRSFIRIIGGGTVAAATLGASGWWVSRDPMPAAAIAPWQGPDAGEPDIRRRLLAWAMLAPNPHNRQPWLVDLREPDVITLYCDRSRLLPETDPFGRQILIGHGAFLELLELAAAAAGLRASIVAFPQGPFADDRVGESPVARIQLRPDANATATPLFAAIPHRRSSKVPFLARSPDFEALQREVPPPFATVGLEARPQQVEEIGNLVQRGWEREALTPRTMQESIDLIRIGGDEIARHRDGISLRGPLFWWGRKLGFIDRAALADTSGAGFRATAARYAALHSATPAFGWIATADNSRITQLAVGRLYARLNLRATLAGQAMHPCSYTLQEYPEQAGHFAETAQLLGIAKGHRVQMLFRLGHADVVEPSPRRPTGDIIMS